MNTNIYIQDMKVNNYLQVFIKKSIRHQNYTNKQGKAKTQDTNTHTNQKPTIDFFRIN